MSQTPATPPTTLDPNAAQQSKSLTGRQQYNVVADTVTGVNVRAKDNLYQGLACLAFMLIGIAIGFFVAELKIVGMVLGAVTGLIVGVLISGIALMIYRMTQHARGRHD